MENLEKLIKSKINCINTYPNTFESLFEIIHDQDNRIFCEEYNGYKVSSTSYKEYKTLCLKFGRFFKHALSNETKNSFVGLMMENNKYWISCFWGLLMAGYRPMLLNVRLGTKLNQDIIDKLNINYVIVDNQNDLKCNEILLSNIDYDNYQDEVPFEWANEIALSTSATSLNIKICVYTGCDIFEQVKNTKGILAQNKMIKAHYEERLKQLAFLPFYHIFGLFATYFWFSVFGRSFVFLQDYSSETILRTTRRLNVTHIFAVPMLWNSVYKGIMKEVSHKDERTQKKFNKGINFSLKLQKAFPKLGLKFAKRAFREVREKTFGDSIKFMISGGSYIPEDTLRILNGIGYPLFNGYGMSEIGITSVELRENVKYRLLGTIGKPFDSIQYKIEDQKLYVKGKSICSKIITKNDIIDVNHDDYFLTNDIAKIDNKNYYYVLGRLDDVVTSSTGEKINPDIIEKELNIPSVNHYSILGLDYDGINALTLIIEIRKDISSLKIKKIFNELENNLLKLEKLNYHIEKIYFTNDAIAAKTAIKVSRSHLIRLINNGDVNLINYNDVAKLKDVNIDDISNEILEKVVRIFAEVLNKNINEIEPDDHFIFDLGGTSLDYLSLLVKLKEEFEMDFNFADNNSCYSAIQFCKFIVKENTRNEI